MVAFVLPRLNGASFQQVGIQYRYSATAPNTLTAPSQAVPSQHGGNLKTKQLPAVWVSVPPRSMCRVSGSEATLAPGSGGGAGSKKMQQRVLASLASTANDDDGDAIGAGNDGAGHFGRRETWECWCVTDLEAGATMEFRLQIRNRVGWSPFSDNTAPCTTACKACHNSKD